MRQTYLLASILLVSAVTSPASADTPQMLTATMGSTTFASDDNNITLIPVSGSFALIAVTAGADAWPPPKTPIDRLSISCPSYEQGKSIRFDSKDFQRSNGCRVEFEKGTKSMGKDSDASYGTDQSASDNLVEITSVNGKVIEGHFHVTLKDKKGSTLVCDGKFKAEDRQL